MHALLRLLLLLVTCLGLVAGPLPQFAVCCEDDEHTIVADNDGPCASTAECGEPDDCAACSPSCGCCHPAVNAPAGSGRLVLLPATREFRVLLPLPPPPRDPDQLLQVPKAA